MVNFPSVVPCDVEAPHVATTPLSLVEAAEAAVLPVKMAPGTSATDAKRFEQARELKLAAVRRDYANSGIWPGMGHAAS